MPRRSASDRARRDAAYRLEEIMEEMGRLNREAIGVIRESGDTGEVELARSYWFSLIQRGLEGDYMSMKNSVQHLREAQDMEEEALENPRRAPSRRKGQHGGRARKHNPRSRDGHTEGLAHALEAAAHAFRPKAHDIRVEVMPDMLEVSFMPADVPIGGTRGVLTSTVRKWGVTVAKLLREHPEATLPALSGKVGQSHEGRIYARVFLT